MKVRRMGSKNPNFEKDPEYQKEWYFINCPGCGFHHTIAVGTSFSNGAKWGFNHNMEKPTFTPSLLIRLGPLPDGSTKVCHSFITDGRIQFLNDCTHKLAGQTVDLPEIE